MKKREIFPNNCRETRNEMKNVLKMYMEKGNHGYLSKEEYITLIKIRLRKADRDWADAFGVIKEADLNNLSCRRLHDIAQVIHTKGVKDELAL